MVIKDLMKIVGIYSRTGWEWKRYQIILVVITAGVSLLQCLYLCGLWVKITSLMMIQTKTCVHMNCWQFLFIKLGNNEIICISVNPKQVLWSSWHSVESYYTV